MSLLNIGTSGLFASQSGLTTTSHNISNVNTEGYSRQRIEQNARLPNGQGDYYIGRGVNITNVERLFDQFLADEVRQFTSQTKSSETFASFAKQIDSLLGAEESSVSTGLDSFFDAVQQVADDPTAIAARQVMLAEAETVANRFNNLDAQLRSYNNQVNLKLESAVSDVNRLARGIAELNQSIRDASSGGSQPNDLLDQRDKLLNDLSQLVSVQTVEQDDGTVNVFVGSGQGLVVGNSVTDLQVVENATDSTRLEVAYGSNNSVISQQLNGGEIGGLLSVRRDVIDPTRQQLDDLAAGVVETMNQQHRAGLTLDGNAGGNLFEDAVTPTAANMRVAITDPRDVAVAFPVTQATDGNNSGTGALTVASVDSSDPAFDATNALTQGPVQFQYNAAAGEYEVTYNGNTQTLAYDPATDSGKTFNLTDDLALPDDIPLSVTLSGTPADGDTFTLSNAPSGANFTQSGDNRNALALAELQVNKTLNPNGAGEPQDSFGDVYGNLLGDVATRTNQAENSRQAQQGLLDSTRARFESVSGVNLDEEAANLIKYQQAYQASAQVINVSNTIFDTLLASF